MMYCVEMMTTDRQATIITLIDIPKEITDNFLYATNYFKNNYIVKDVYLSKMYIHQNFIDNLKGKYHIDTDSIITEN